MSIYFGVIEAKLVNELKCKLSETKAYSKIESCWFVAFLLSITIDDCDLRWKKFFNCSSKYNLAT